MTKSEKYYFRSCKTLPIYNFYEILNTGNLNWLVKGFDEDSDEQELDFNFLVKLWEKIHSEYVDILGDSSETKDYLTIAQINEMEAEVVVVESLIDLIKIKRSKRIIKEINAWGYFGDDIEKTVDKLKVLRFKISIFKSKNKKLLNPEEKKDKEEDRVYDLFKDIIAVEKAFGDGYRIDPHKTVLSKWGRLILEAQRKNKANAKRSNRFNSH